MVTGDAELGESGEIVPPGDQRRSTTLVSDCWLLLVRAGWWASAIYTLVLFSIGVPMLFAQLQTVCTSMLCDNQQLSPVAVQFLISLGISLKGYAIAYTMVLVVTALVWFGVAGLLFWRKSNDWLALLVSLMLLMQGAVNVVRIVENASALLPFLAHIVDFLAFFLLSLVFSVFPDGRVVPRRWAYWLLLGWAIVNVGSAFNTLASTAFFALIWYSIIGSFVAAQIYRYRRLSSRVQRQQTKWIVFMVMITFCCELGTFFGDAFEFFSHRQDIPLQFALSLVAEIAPILIPLGFGVAILRYRLWDIDVLINRTLVYGILTASVIGLYILVVGILGTVLQAQGNIVIELVATGLVAVFFQPLRNVLQRGINRLMFGERDDPYRVVSRLGQRLEATLAPGEVLPAIVETVARSLKLPSVAIRLKEDEIFTMVACYGLPKEPLLHLPLIYQAEMLGELVLAPRTAHESFTGSERHLLNELARQAGVAVHTMLLTTDLERSRQHIVAAREEARRRLGSDLHDGLGHTLAGLLRTADTASQLLERDPASVQLLLSEMKQRIKSAIDDARRLAHSLHPPELELLGLLQALRERVQQYQQPSVGGLRIHLESPPTLPPLPIAVEAATYYIALEALNNVQRHAQAQSCQLRLDLVASDATSKLLPGVWNTSVLELEICDNGQGLPEEAQEKSMGLGFASMRERATELGGTCLIEQVATGGTRVFVRLPCLHAKDDGR